MGGTDMGVSLSQVGNCKVWWYTPLLPEAECTSSLRPAWLHIASSRTGREGYIMRLKL